MSHPAASQPKSIALPEAACTICSAIVWSQGPGTNVPIATAVQMANATNSVAYYVPPRAHAPLSKVRLEQIAAGLRQFNETPHLDPKLVRREALREVRTLDDLPENNDFNWFEDADYCAALARVCVESRPHDSELMSVTWSRRTSRFGGKVSFRLDDSQRLGGRLWHLPVADGSRAVAVREDGVIFGFRWLANRTGDWGTACSTGSKPSLSPASRRPSR
jgi:hypothetical protein